MKDQPSRREGQGREEGPTREETAAAKGAVESLSQRVTVVVVDDLRS